MTRSLTTCVDEPVRAISRCCGKVTQFRSALAEDRPIGDILGTKASPVMPDSTTIYQTNLRHKTPALGGNATRAGNRARSGS